MPMTVMELDNGVTKVVITGRIDIAGAQDIDLPLNVVGGSRRAVVIDLTDVTFMASMGLRGLVMCAKAIHSKRGKVSMFGPRDDVAEVIRTMGIDELIPLLPSEAEAIAAVTAG
jgi:anti-sigma B factor antagonist